MRLVITQGRNTDRTEESRLSRKKNTNSYSANLETFRLYVWQRQEGLAERLAFYADLGHRRRRWKS